MRNTIDIAGRPLAWLAPLSWALSVAGFGAALGGFSHAQHPVALLGARGVERAVAFNVLGFMLPGLLVTLLAVALRRRLDAAGWAARIGARLLLLSGLAFAMQGLLPLDPTDLDAQASRLHALAWSLWWIAFASAAVLLALRSRALAIAAVVAAIAYGLAMLLSPAGAWQRVAIAAWFVFALVAMHVWHREPAPDRAG